MKQHRGVPDGAAQALAAANATATHGKPPDAHPKQLEAAQELAKEAKGGKSYTGGGKKYRWRQKGGRWVANAGKAAGTQVLFQQAKKEFGKDWTKAAHLAKEWTDYAPDVKELQRNWGVPARLFRKCKDGKKVSLTCFFQKEPWGKEFYRLKSAGLVEQCRAFQRLAGK